ncbi:MAG: hypothetical protein IRY91_16700 [Gemmatimonadaceae bacterium]|nr:hypothetical protein [Gemmatimonadaceae bacterium]
MPLLVALLALAFPLQASDTALVAAERSAHAALVRDGGRLWHARLDTIPWLAVDAAGKRVSLSADPGLTGYTRVGDGLWVGPLPPGITPANTSIEWAGRRWAMIVLPLPSDSAARTRLLVHEVWHVVQPAVLPLPAVREGSAGAALLDEPEGRTWLQLEWRALADALDGMATPGVPRERVTRALERALLFRARRYLAAAPEERDRERLLDMSEGLAEYTAWRLTGGDPRALAHEVRGAPAALSTFVRGFPYYMGPAYAMALDWLRRGASWTSELRGTPDLQRLVARSLPTRDDRPVEAWLLAAERGAPDALARRLRAAAEREGASYDLASLRAAESARWHEHEQRLAALRATFVDGPTLRIVPGSLAITFDPRAQIALGAAGTVMPGLAWKTADGASLSAPAGALVSTDWSELRVPLDTLALAAGTLDSARTWHAAGWTLTLPRGWVLVRDGHSWVARPPAR